MTLGTKAVTHFRATFEKVLHIRTGAPAPKIIKKQMRMIIICINRKVKKTQMIMVIIWVVVFHVEQFSVNLNNDEKLDENHYHWAERLIVSRIFKGSVRLIGQISPRDIFCHRVSSHLWFRVFSEFAALSQ